MFSTRLMSNSGLLWLIDIDDGSPSIILLLYILFLIILISYLKSFSILVESSWVVFTDVCSPRGDTLSSMFSKPISNGWNSGVFFILTSYPEFTLQTFLRFSFEVLILPNQKCGLWLFFTVGFANDYIWYVSLFTFISLVRNLDINFFRNSELLTFVFLVCII